MNKIMTAALALSFLSGTVVFAQNTATGSTMKTKVKHKHSKKGATGETTTSAATK